MGDLTNQLYPIQINKDFMDNMFFSALFIFPKFDFY